jgi:hypothetical protein
MSFTVLYCINTFSLEKEKMPDPRSSKGQEMLGLGEEVGFENKYNRFREWVEDCD